MPAYKITLNVEGDFDLAGVDYDGAPPDLEAADPGDKLAVALVALVREHGFVASQVDVAEATGTWTFDSAGEPETSVRRIGFEWRDDEPAEGGAEIVPAESGGRLRAEANWPRATCVHCDLPIMAVGNHWVHADGERGCRGGVGQRRATPPRDR